MTSRARRYLPEAVAFAVAVGVRLVAIGTSPGGFDGAYGYDQSVYYASAASLLHGRVPYHDFVLVHPPLIMLALLPAALLGHLASDHAGYVAANVGFGVLSAVNAALVVVVARRLGLRTSAAAAGGLFYAVWFVTVSTESSARLEPLANFFFLLALLALVVGADRVGRSGFAMLALAGALFGAAMSVKIWFVVPLAVAAGWVMFPGRRVRAAVPLLAGSAGAVLLINVPFLVASGGDMWSMVIDAQLGRGETTQPFAQRLTDLGAAYSPRLDSGSAGVIVATVFGLGLIVAILALAWRVTAARLVVLCAAACLVTLLVVPSWFARYADFAAVPVALAAAAAAHTLVGRRRVLGWLPFAAAGGATLAVLAQSGFPVTTWWGPPEIAAAAGHVRCVTSDTPEGLIALNVLDRDLRYGCDTWVDTMGRALLDQDARSLRLAHDLEWQRTMLVHLWSGQLAYPYLPIGTYAPQVRRELAAHPTVVVVSGPDGRRYALYRGQGVAPAR